MTPERFTVHGRNYQLRRAVSSDVERIVSLLADDPLRQAENPAGPEHQGAHLAAFQTIAADPAQLLVVVEDGAGTVVATMQLTVIPGLSRLGATRLLIEAVRVDARLRGAGLGTAMMHWAAEEGRRRGATMIQLTSDKSRDAAHRFYERLGFKASHVGFKLPL